MFVTISLFILVLVVVAVRARKARLAAAELLHTEQQLYPPLGCGGACPSCAAEAWFHEEQLYPPVGCGCDLCREQEVEFERHWAQNNYPPEGCCSRCDGFLYPDQGDEDDYYGDDLSDEDEEELVLGGHHTSDCECFQCEAAAGRDLAIRRAMETGEGWENL